MRRWRQPNASTCSLESKPVSKDSVRRVDVGMVGASGARWWLVHWRGGPGEASGARWWLVHGRGGGGAASGARWWLVHGRGEPSTSPDHEDQVTALDLLVLPDGEPLDGASDSGGDAGLHLHRLDRRHD